MNLDIHSLISENISRGIPFVLSTVIRTEGSTPSVMGSRMIIYRDGKTEGTVGGGALEHLVIDDSKQIFSSGMNLTKTYDLTDKEQGTGMECGGMVEIMFEVFTKRPHIMIFGGGHIALELSKILDIIRFEYSVIDNRKEFAEKTRFPRAVKIYHGDYADFDFEAEITDNCYGVIVTHGHEYDKECLAKLIKTQARYIGMIGSKIKVENTLNALKTEVYDPMNDNRIFSPIGLDLGGDSPELIALSIVGEIVKFYFNKPGNHLSLNRLPRNT